METVTVYTPRATQTDQQFVVLAAGSLGEIISSNEPFESDLELRISASQHPTSSYRSPIAPHNCLVTPNSEEIRVTNKHRFVGHRVRGSATNEHTPIGKQQGRKETTERRHAKSRSRRSSARKRSVSGFSSHPSRANRADFQSGRKRLYCSSPNRSSDQPSTVSSSAIEPSTLTLASAPVSNCGEILSVDLGATASKRRRRDRQRSAVCPNPTEHTQLKPSYSAGGKLLHHRATEVSSLQLGCDGRSRAAVSIKQGTTEISNATGNGTNTMLSEGAPESNQPVSVAQSACTGLLSHQYATCTPSLYLVPGSVPPTPSSERYVSRRSSTHRTTVVTGTEQNLYVIPHGANQPAADGSRSDHRNTQSYHQPSTLPIDLTVPPGSQLRTVSFSSNPCSMSGASPVDPHQPVNIAYLPSADFSAQATLPSDGTGQSSATGLNYTIPHSVLNTGPLHYDGRTVMSLSYQAGKPPPNAILPVFTDTSSAPLLVTPSPVGTTYSVSHHPHEQQSQQKQHQDLLNSINVARFISLNSAPRNPKAAATTDISSFSSLPTNSSQPPTQFSTKLSRHTNVETNLIVSAGLGRDVVNWSVARGSTSHAGGRHSPHILLMGFEENLINMNVHSLVSCILDILECGEEHLIELKNLGCNVLTHMMDALPRSSEAVVPALPLLLTTMSSSFVGDILERIINLLEQLSRRHGREVLQSGAIMSALGFYDFVTLAQHRTILTMVANCFVNLQPSDFELIIDCLPGLAERLKAPEPRCVEHVCTCFVRLVNTYRNEPELLKRIVTTCDLFTNLQHLLMASPPVLSSVRDVIHMLAIVCSSCPELAVELVKKNISSTLYCILTGEAIDSDTLQSIISCPLDNPSLLAPLTGDQPGSPRRHRSHSGNTRKRTSFSKHSRPEVGDDLGSSATLGPPDIWPPLMLTLSPLSDSLPLTASVTKRSQEDVHSIVQLIWYVVLVPGLLPPVPPHCAGQLLGIADANTSMLVQRTGCESTHYQNPGSLSSLIVNSASAGGPTDHLSPDNRSIPHRSASDRSSTGGTSEHRHRGTTSLVHRLSVPLNQLVIDDSKVASSSSSSSSGTLRRPGAWQSDRAEVGELDPRVRLLRSQCNLLHKQLVTRSSPRYPTTTTVLGRRVCGRHHPNDQPLESTGSVHPPDANSHANDADSTALALDVNNIQALQTVQILLPLLFELFTETTKLQTRLRCMEAIQRMLFYSSPVLLAKTLRPRVVCSHIVGMLNSPERRVVLSGLHIALWLISRIPPMFATYFRKEGILHQVSLWKMNLSTPATRAQSSLHSLANQIDETTSSSQSATTGHHHASMVSHISISRLFYSYLPEIQTASISTHCSLDETRLLADVESQLWIPADGRLKELPQFASSTPYVDRVREETGTHHVTDLSSRGSCRRSGATVSAPVLLTLPLEGTESSSPASDVALNQWIESACWQLESRVVSVAHISNSCSSSHTSTGSGPKSHATPTGERSPSVITDAVDIDLMPKLVSIATHVNSNKPALWVFAFSQLIQLLQPMKRVNATHIEPPSPFELQKSGVTEALLSYLTATDAREARLWILYRMFFGARACMNNWIPPVGNLLLSKKQNSSKNWPHLLNMSPVLMSTTKADQLHEVDAFIDQQTACVDSLTSDGPSAFNALLECLLACFHRHEHFQVTGLPSTLPPDSRLLALIQTEQPNSGSVSAENSNLMAANPTHSKKAEYKDSSISSGPLSVPNSPCSDNLQSRGSTRSRGQRFQGTRPHLSKLSCSKQTIQSGSSPSTDQLLSKPSATTHLPDPHLPPTPGFMWVEFVRLASPDEDIDCDSANCSGTRSGVCSKNCRKSSSSSSSISSHLSTTSGATNDVPLSVPSRLPLQITALATFQLVERILLQRSYISSLMHEKPWNSDHYYGLTDVYSLSPREGDLREFLDVRGPGEDSDNNDDGTIDPRRHQVKKDSSVSKRSYNRSHRNHASFSSTCRTPECPSDVDSISGTKQTNSSSRTSVFSEPVDHPIITSITYPVSAMSSEFATLHSFVQLNSTSQAPQGSSGSYPPNSNSFQRGLRSLPQRGAEGLPMFTAGVGEDIQTSDSRRTDKPSESWGLRRRSATKFNHLRDGSNSQTDNTSSASYAAHLLPSNLANSENPVSESQRTVSGSSSRISPNVLRNPSFSVVNRETTSSEHSTSSQKLTTSAQVGGSRHRRLRGSSILAAFGALSNLSSVTLNPQAASYKQQSSKTFRGGSHNASNNSVGSTAVSRRSFAMGSSNFSSMSPSSVSNSSASMSPVSTETSSLFRGKCRAHLQFYIDGHQLPSNLPIFEAILKFSPEFKRRLSGAQMRAVQQTCGNATEQFAGNSALTERELEELIGHLMWSMTHVVHYRVLSTPVHGDSASNSYSARKTEQHSVGALGSKTSSGSSTKTSSLSYSPPSTGTFGSAITCLKRRRSDDLEVAADAHVDKSYDPPNSPTCPINSTSCLNDSKHPLFSKLTRDLPKGLLSERRCSCDCSKGGCPTASINTNEEDHFSAELNVASWNLTEQPIFATLSLLRVFHAISRFWYTLHDVLDPYPILSPTVFRSPKLAIKANRQLQDPFSVLAGNLPGWLTHLISTCPFLFPFDIRRMFFYAYNFDRDRTLLRFQDATSAVSEMEQQMVTGYRNPTVTNVQDNSLLSVPHSSIPRNHMSSEFPQSGNPGSPVSNSGLNYLSLLAPSAENGQLIPNIVLPIRPDSTRHSHVRSRYHTRLALSPNLRRHKVTVHRDGKRLLRQAESTLSELMDSRAVLEIAFDNEVGFGLGPTLEFYTLVSRELMKSSLNLWYGSETTNDGYVVAPASGLYPRPLAKQARSAVVREVRSRFVFLGRLMARALLDWRQLDLPFSAAFFKWFLASSPLEAISDGHILPNDLALVDPELARHLRQLADMANRRQYLCRQLTQQLNNVTHIQGGSHTRGASFIPVSSSKSSCASRGSHHRGVDELKAALLVLDNEIEDLCLNFVLPGYDIELLKNGSHVMVNGSNLGDYIRLVAHWLVIEGVNRQMESVIEGFDSVLPKVRQRLAVLFQPDEMEGLFCGRSFSHFETLWGDNSGSPSRSGERESSTSNEWDVQKLTESCRCDHGYTPQSRSIRNLFEVMSEFDEEERRLFLQFVTGSPRLPVGGFRALKPPLKIVLKRESGENADSHLPSVMTCQNYLKLPDYSSKEMLASKLHYAIREGQNAFHLS
ncbi:HECT-domain protein [Opisthorchis viverrini]|uniref:E3 ubiquitin-protein ligase n=1 Tax=Opisthorchis viverrini TaxID=6198 RepID=A0A1S8WH24_OPIVI|nr:HECT-domain protein [Opisthorchis viverrini]